MKQIIDEFNNIFHHSKYCLEGLRTKDGKIDEKTCMCELFVFKSFFLKSIKEDREKIKEWIKRTKEMYEPAYEIGSQGYVQAMKDVYTFIDKKMKTIDKTCVRCGLSPGIKRTCTVLTRNYSKHKYEEYKKPQTPDIMKAISALERIV